MHSILGPSSNFKDVRMDERLRSGPLHVVIRLSPTGWINNGLFFEWLHHFIDSFPQARIVILIMDSYLIRITSIYWRQFMSREKSSRRLKENQNRSNESMKSIDFRIIIEKMKNKEKISRKTMKDQKLLSGRPRPTNLFVVFV